MEVFFIKTKYKIAYLPKSLVIKFKKLKYEELLIKNQRPFMCFLFKYKYNFYICLPFRTNLNHKQGFRFRNTKRSRKHKSGIDYSKMVLTRNLNGFKFDVLLDRDEFKETIKYHDIIIYKSTKYLNDYINFINGKIKIGNDVFNKRYKYTTLRYFHEYFIKKEN